MTEKAYCEVCNTYMGLKKFIGRRKTCSDKCRKKKSRDNKGKVDGN